MSAIHADTPIDALSHRERGAIMSGADIPLPAIRMQVASAVDCAVHAMRLISPEGKVVGSFVLKEKPSFAEQAAIAQLQLPEYK